MSRIEHVCGVEKEETVSFSTLVAATAAWLVVLAAALVVKLVADGGWSDPGPALLLAAAPIAAALVLKMRGQAGWSLSAAAAILGGATLFPSLLFKEWAETVFEMGGSAGYLIILLAYYRNQGWRIIIPALILAGIMLGATALSIRF
jgi:hypothetical protein